MVSITRLQRHLPVDVPLIQGPFGGGLSSVELVVAVNAEGGLGSFGVHHLDGAGIRAVAEDIRRKTNRPFALNLWIPSATSDTSPLTDAAWQDSLELLRPYYHEMGVPLPNRPGSFAPSFEEQVETVLEVAPPVFSFVFGVPSPEVLERCRSLGIRTLGAATTVEEAKVLEHAGVDFIVATGFEAGGHRVSFLRPPEDCLMGTLALVPQVVDSVRIPVIAAGGIADGRGVSAAFSLGAAAVQIGTAFLACEESNAPSIHRDQLFSAAARRTVLTRAFSGRLARAIHNRLVDELRGREASIPPYPVQNWLNAQLRAAALAGGRADLISLWSGQSAPLLRHRRVATLMSALRADLAGRS